MTTSAPAPPTAARSTWALFTHRHITWRQAGEGWAVVLAAGGCVLGVAIMAKAVRSVARSRTWH